MKWLRFAGQYISTGINPGAGFKVVTNIRMSNQFSTMPLFGARSSGSASTASFNMFYTNTFVVDHYEAKMQPDYGGSGSAATLPIDFSTLPGGEKMIFSIEFGKTTKVNGVEWTSPTDNVATPYPILVGSISNGASADTRKMFADVSDFIIYNASGDVVFNGVPVPTGSTEYSVTPAPSNCYWDLVSGSYKVQSGGTGVVWYDDEDDDLAEENSTTLQGVDYGLKVLAEGDENTAYMNSKYPLFGADISSPASQFKTYEFTLTGFNAEPSPPFPAYTYDGNFYQGSGVTERTAYTIDTGLGGSTVKSVIVQNSEIDNSVFYGRAREQLFNSGTGDNINSLLNPKSKTALPASPWSTLYLADGSTGDIQGIVSLGTGTSVAKYDTLAGFNGGTLDAYYFTQPKATVKIDAAGILTVKTSVPYKWIQRAFIIGSTTYRARWRDWIWYQGVTIRVTVLNTPYVIE